MGPLDIIYVGGLPRDALADDALHVGGMGILAVEILNGLAKRGHRIRTLSAIPENDRSGRFVGLSPEVETATYDMPRPTHSPTGPCHFDNHGARIARGLPALIKTRRPDIVFVAHQAFVGAFPDVLEGYGTPWLVWVHTTVWPRMMFGDGAVPNALVERMFGAMRRSDAAVAVADHVAKGLKAQGFPNVATVRNAVDIDRFRPARAVAAPPGEVGTDDIVVAHVSNLKTVKRAEDLIRSAASALERDTRLVYLVVGDGPCRTDLEALSRSEGIAGRVRFTGWLPRDTVADILARADIAVLPSAAEGLSLSLLEALACGCAVVASDIEGMREVVRDGETARLVPVGDVDALARHTVELAASPKLRRRLGDAGRRHVEAHHGMEQMLDRLEEVFARLVRQ